MAKNKSWFNLVKRFFLFEAASKTEKKDKRRKWLFGRFRTKRLASLTAPSPPRDRTKSETEEEQDINPLTVAIATAAAAEAAVAAAQVAAEALRLTGIPQSNCKFEGETEEQSQDAQPDNSPSNEHERQIQVLAARKIQATFRGHLARKALRALKGIVKLQAIIRGWAVRRQAMNTLKCLQSIISIQSQVCARRFQMAEGAWHCDENEQLLTLKDKIIKVDINNQRRWDDSILTKEEVDATVLSKKGAAIKRERIKEYSYFHRKSSESEQNKGNGKYWLDHWVDTQITKSKELEVLDSVLTSDRRPAEEYRAKQLRLKIFPRQYHYHIEELDSPVPVPRRSFHRKQCSLGEDNSFSTSPIVPTYMAATQSAKARERSMSSPKLRPGSFDAQSESYLPYKNNLSLISSVTLTSEVPSSCRVNSRPSSYQQRSPGLKGAPGPVKSNRNLKDLSFN